MSSIITASIVIYKTQPAQLSRLLEAWAQANNTGDLYLIDNSPEESEYFRNTTINKVQYIFNNNNAGYGRGHNVAIRKVLDSSKYHVVINPDIEMEPAVIAELFQFMEQHSDIGHVMPKILYPNGDIQYVCKLLPTPFDLFARRFLPSFFFRESDAKYALEFTNYDKIMDVPNLSGCFMFLRVEALKQAGMFDERFFMYGEDIDLTRTINQQFRTVFYPNVFVIHEHAAGSYKNLKLLWVHIVNIVKYFNKWGWFQDKERKTINARVLKALR